MRIATAALALILAGAAYPGFAQPVDTSGDVAARARSCFLRGVELYEERDFAGAGVEFRRAYELLPNYRVLFNLGRVAVEQHDYASAIDSFTRYLSEGGDKVPIERRRELSEELEHLRPRVGQISVTTEEVGAEVYLDDVLVGRTPLAPMAVNVGRRRIEVRTKQGRSEVRVVDAPGQEIVRIHVARTASKPVALGPREAAPAFTIEKDVASEPRRQTSTRVWIGWTATAVCAGGAAVVGLLAYRSSRDLSDLRQSFPVTRETLDGKQRDTRTLSAVADGLLAGTVVLGGLSLYFSLSTGTKKDDSPSRLSVGLGWPGVVDLRGRF
jgi:PEGA domain